MALQALGGERHELGGGLQAPVRLAGIDVDVMPTIGIMRIWRGTTYDGELRPVHDELMDALEGGERGHTKDLAALCANVLDLRPALSGIATMPRKAQTRPHASALSAP